MLGNWVKCKKYLQFPAQSLGHTFHNQSEGIKYFPGPEGHFIPQTTAVIKSINLQGILHHNLTPWNQPWSLKEAPTLCVVQVSLNTNKYVFRGEKQK